MIDSLAPNLTEFKKLPRHVQARALLRLLKERVPEDSFNHRNLLLQPYGTPDPNGFALGFPENERQEAVKHLLRVPWQHLVLNGFVADVGRDFFEITEDGHEEATKDIAAASPDRAVVDALRFLHPDLQGSGHYFTEGKLKEAVGAAFRRVENRLNEVRDASVDPAVKNVSGVNLPYKLFETGDLKFPFSKLAASNATSREAYAKQLKGLLTAGVGWFRNSFDHEPHNLPDLNEGEALELLFVVSYMLRTIDRSV